MVEIVDVSRAVEFLRADGASDLAVAKAELLGAVWEYKGDQSAIPLSCTLGKLKGKIEKAGNQSVANAENIRAAYETENERHMLPPWLKGLMTALEEVQRISNGLIDGFPKAPGQNPDWAFYNLLKAIVGIYERHTGRPATTNDSSPDKKATEFQRFAWEVFNAAGHDFSKHDFDRRVHDAKPGKNYSTVS